MNVLERITGDIVDYDGAYITLRVPYNDTETFLRRGYKQAEVILEDARKLSGRQRRNVYAMLREIADWAGYDEAEVKDIMKVDFWLNHLWQTADTMFSLADAPMSVVAAFQSFIARFIVNNDVPTKVSMLNYVDDVADYVYACLAAKKCCVCGKRADLHHVDRIGMGRNRDDVIHIGLKVLPLCREHHGEAHGMSDADFMAKYHLCDGIEADKTICRIYGLKGK